jgi:hypothetical protein
VPTFVINSGKSLEQVLAENFPWCVEWEKEARAPPNARASLLEMAHVWQHLADEQGRATNVQQQQAHCPPYGLARKSTASATMPKPVGEVSVTPAARK